MNGLTQALLVLMLAGCAATPKFPSPSPATSVKTQQGQRLAGTCAAASLVVVPEKGTFQFGHDPVETHQFSLLSRTFRFTLAKSRPELSVARYKVVRQGKSAILKLVAAAPTKEQALKSCEALASVALAHDDPAAMADDPAKAWLADQRRTLQRQKDAADRQLHEFRKSNKLLSIGTSDRLSLIHSRLMDLVKARDKAPKGRRRDALNKAVDAVMAEALELNRLQIDYNRLKRTADNATKMLDMLHQRESGLGLDRLLNRRVRLLDRCAPIECI